MTHFKAIIPKEAMQVHGLSAKKSFGQNFLHDETHLVAIAKAVSGLSKAAASVPVIEFGAGLGALTAALLNEAVKLHAVERDRDLVPLLQAHFRDAILEGSLVLHEDNAVTFDCDQVGASYVLCGNLPYHLSSQLLFRCLDLYPKVVGAVFLLQQEVVERIAAPPGSRTYGLLSVLLQARFEVSLIRYVKKGAFWPPPQIDSAVLYMKARPENLALDANWDLFVKVVKAAFAQRRKTLRNALGAQNFPLEAIAKAGLDEKARAEVLSVQDYIALTQAIVCSE